MSVKNYSGSEDLAFVGTEVLLALAGATLGGACLLFSGAPKDAKDVFNQAAECTPARSANGVLVDKDGQKYIQTMEYDADGKSALTVCKVSPPKPAGM